MKFPKNRANLYVVIREEDKPTMDHDGRLVGYLNTAILGAFADFNEADDFRESCQQEWIDKTGDLTDVNFGIRLTTYYG